MTVSELMSVLSELDGTDLVVVGHPMLRHSADKDYTPLADSVYAAIVEFNGDEHNCVVLDMEGAGS